MPPLLRARGQKLRPARSRVLHRSCCHHCRGHCAASTAGIPWQGWWTAAVRRTPASSHPAPQLHRWDRCRKIIPHPRILSLSLCCYHQLLVIIASMLVNERWVGGTRHHHRRARTTVITTRQGTWSPLPMVRLGNLQLLQVKVNRCISCPPATEAGLPAMAGLPPVSGTLSTWDFPLRFVHCSFLSLSKRRFQQFRFY